MYKVMVYVCGESTPSSNALRFNTVEEATTYAKDLYSRWTAVERYEVVEATDAN